MKARWGTAMVRMSDVWDRTTAVLRGRASMLATIALLLSFLPQVTQYTIATFFSERSVAYFATVTVVALVVGLLAIWSGLTLVAGASDPGTTLGKALAIGAARLPVAIGLTVMMLLATVILFVPVLILIGASGLRPAMLVPPATPLAFAGVSPAAIAGAALWLLFIVFPVAFWVAARLAVFTPVLVNERLGLGTFVRAWRLTRGLAWRIIGVFVLFILLYLIVAAAAQLVVTLLFRLALGAQGGGIALFFGAVATSAAAAAFGVVTSTFTAQLYRTLTGREAAETFA